MNRPRRLINQRLARSLFLRAASDWGRPMAHPPAGFYAELEKALTLKSRPKPPTPATASPSQQLPKLGPFQTYPPRT